MGRHSGGTIIPGTAMTLQNHTPSKVTQADNGVAPNLNATQEDPGILVRYLWGGLAGGVNYSALTGCGPYAKSRFGSSRGGSVKR